MQRALGRRHTGVQEDQHLTHKYDVTCKLLHIRECRSHNQTYLCCEIVVTMEKIATTIPASEVASYVTSFFILASTNTKTTFGLRQHGV